MKFKKKKSFQRIAKEQNIPSELDLLTGRSTFNITQYRNKTDGKRIIIVEACFLSLPLIRVNG